MFHFILFLIILAHFIDADFPALSVEGAHHFAATESHQFHSEIQSSTFTVNTEATYVFSKQQLNALHALYNSTNGKNWDWETNTAVYGIKWNFNVANANPCSSKWQGITCTYGTQCTSAKPCNVISLALPAYDLIGSIPAAIGNLTYLTTLNLSSNNIFNSIPRSIGLIRNLSVLSLATNHINGTIPSTIANLTSLSQLVLSGNRLTGSIPEMLYLKNKHLQTIELGDNHLTGSLSGKIGNLKKLTVLDLSTNLLTYTIPEEIGDCKYLQQLILNDNGLNGTISTSLASLKSLIYLELGANLLSGTFPKNVLSELNSLQILSLLQNRLTSSIPDEFQNMANLTAIDLYANRFNGSFPSSLTNCRKLTSIDIHNNLFSGPLPEDIGNLQSLIDLSLSLNELNGTIPESLYTMHSMQYLFLETNLFTGNISANISSLRSLFNINLSANRFRGTIPNSFEELNYLTYIYLGRNFLTGTIPPRMSSNLYVLELDLHGNFLSGSVPRNLTTTYPFLQTLSLANNNLNGSIPGEIFSEGFTLSQLDLSVNFLTGTIPTVYSNPIGLRFIYLQSNFLHGPIPSNINELTYVTRLDLSDNFFTGTLPESYLELPLLSVDVHNNLFNGTIPKNITKLEKIFRLDLSYNNFTGTIPSDIGIFTDLQDFILNGNHFFGTFPTSFQNLTKINVIYMEDNLFSQQIPSDFFVPLAELKYFRIASNAFTKGLPSYISPTARLWQVFDVANNYFTSTIPINICEQQFMKTLILNGNSFSKSIPSALFLLGGLIELDLSNNFFTGTISSDFKNATILQNLSLGTNFLRSTFPNVFDRIKLLSELYLNNNFFTGTIPDTIFNLLELEILYLSGNGFTGSIPPSITGLRKISTVNMSSNGLSGTVNNLFNGLNHLEILILSNNQFEGHLDNLVNNTLQKVLNTIDISNNQMSGTIPKELFLNSSNHLLSFAAVKNCITGTIPQEVCSATELTALALDGLHTSARCVTQILPFSKSQSYLIPESLKGTIPSCLYQMQYLEVLHVSGNGITGSLPKHVELSTSLSDLSLSHNILKGSIPKSFQENIWYNFDLSFNKFSGIISENISNFLQMSNSSLTLEINRLSGGIPSQLMEAPTISILKGNIFECSNHLNPDASLPGNDPDAHSYTCGSDDVNISLSVWFGVILITFLIPLLSYSFIIQIRHSYFLQIIQEYRDRFLEWWSVYKAPHSRPSLSPVAAGIDHVYDFGLVMTGIRHFCSSCLFFIVAILLPVHVMLGFFYTTYTYQYAWILSIAFLSGKTPAIVLLLFLVLFLLFIQGRLTFLFQKQTKDSQKRVRQHHKIGHSRKSFIQQLQKNISKELVAVMVALTVFNCIIVLIVQFSYVFALTYGLNHFTLVVVAMFVAAFNVFWNNFIVIDVFSKIMRHSQSKLKHQLLKELPPMPLEHSMAEIEEKRKTAKKMLLSSESSVGADEEQGGRGLSQPSLDQSSSSSTVSSSFISNPLQQSTEDPQQQLPQQSMQENHPPSFASTVSTSPPRSTTSSTTDALANEVLRISSLSKINNEHNLFNEERRIYFLTHLLLFNNVLAPIAASAFVSADCFYYMVVTPPEVQTSYSVLLCTEYLDSLLVEGNCFSYDTFIQNISYLPPFFYSYQCSSALLTSFAYVYLMKYLYIGVVLPFFRIGIKYLQEWFYWKYPHLTNSGLFAVICWFLYVPLQVITPIELKKEREQKRQSEWRKRTTTVVSVEEMMARGTEMIPVPSLYGRENRKNSHITEVTDIESNHVNKDDQVLGEQKKRITIVTNPLNNHQNHNQRPTDFYRDYESYGEGSVSLTKEEREKQKKLLVMNNHFLFQAKRIVNREYVVLPILSEFTVFITFGAIFPPLAIAVCYTIFITTYFIQLMIGRFLFITKLQKELKIYITKVNEECCNFRRLFLQSIPSVSILASFFWGFFLFDILGDDVSSISASLWILFGMGVAPILIYFGEKLVFYYLPEKETDDDEQEKENGEVNSNELEKKDDEEEEKDVNDIDVKKDYNNNNGGDVVEKEQEMTELNSTGRMEEGVYHQESNEVEKTERNDKDEETDRGSR
jgi:Leucine-rich repeat (LRR) protein